MTKETTATTREKLLFAAGAVALVIVLAMVGGLVYLAHKASLGALRLWAVIATCALPVTALVAFWLGRIEARGTVAGLKVGIDAVTSSASKVADVRVTTAQRLKARPTPTVQQVFLPGLPGAMGGGLILPPSAPDSEEVEL